MTIVSVLALTGAAFLSTDLAAQEAGVEQCEQAAASQIISIVVCPKGLTAEQMAEAGKKICGERLPCGARSWSDPGAAPEVAPENHDGLTQAQVTSAMGVWVAEQEQFISIEKVE